MQPMTSSSSCGVAPNTRSRRKPARASRLSGWEEAACSDGRVLGLISLGTPVEVNERLYGYEFLSQCAKPKLFISGTRDQYGPRAQLQKIFDAVPEPKQVVWIEGGDHFFEGKLDRVRAAIGEWADKI